MGWNENVKGVRVEKGELGGRLMEEFCGSEKRAKEILTDNVQGSSCIIISRDNL